VISVGSTTSTDVASSFSSRGPVTVDGSNRRKPDVAAPGSSVRSSTRTTTTSYGTMSGTSMAGPHVAAAVALIVSAQPALRGDVDAIEDLIEQNTLPLTTTQGCGGDTSSQVPNNVYGWGRLDVLAAVQAALALDLLTVDDFELGTFCRWDALDPATPLCQ
jgi:subtilisin family serine protease